MNAAVRPAAVQAACLLQRRACMLYLGVVTAAVHASEISR
jgi:hypothetical protein